MPVAHLTNYGGNVTIASGTALTDAINAPNGVACIVMPAAWTAANLTFQVSTDGAAFADLYDATGTEYTVTAAAGRAILLPLADLLGIRFFRIRSGTAATPVNQAAARSLFVLTA